VSFAVHAAHAEILLKVPLIPAIPRLEQGVAARVEKVRDAS